MKIAMLTNNYKPFVGGVPISVERLAKELRKQGHKVTVFAPDMDLIHAMGRWKRTMSSGFR